MNSILETPKTKFSGPWIRMANPQLVSLAMIIHKCADYYDISKKLSEEIAFLSRVEDQNVNIPSKELKRVLPLLTSVFNLISSLGISDQALRHHAAQLAADTWLGSRIQQIKPISYQTMIRDLSWQQRFLALTLANIQFVQIQSDHAQFFEQDELFGEEVNSKFPDARVDIREAGNCLAVSLYTASVFHFMRVAEYGLRRLARRLKIKLTHGAKPLPLDHADWGKVITGIQNKIDAIRKLPPGPKRQAKLEMYSNAADHCEYMKDIWRNTVSHARRAYSEYEAMESLDRVKAFMQFLGKEL